MSKRAAPKGGRKTALYVELGAAETAALDAIVAERQAQTPDRKVTRAEIVRGWIRGARIESE